MAQSICIYINKDSYFFCLVLYFVADFEIWLEDASQMFFLISNMHIQDLKTLALRTPQDIF